MSLSPVVLFVYNRPEHTQKTVEALKNNYLAKESELFVFSDAPRNQESVNKVKLVREYLKTIDGFRRVSVYEHRENLGLSRCIAGGVTEIINQYGMAIVLEDDLLVSQYFLKFMNEALVFYEKEEKVISICGHVYPVNFRNQDTFFLRIADCWGWATWKRGWDLFEPDAGILLERLKAKNKVKAFDLNGAQGYSKMLKKQSQKTISSWAICWYASAFLSEKLSLYPYKSLIQNIGFDDSGENCSGAAGYSVDIIRSSVVISKIPLIENQQIMKKIIFFLRVNQFKRIIISLLRFIRRDYKRHV